MNDREIIISQAEKSLISETIWKSFIQERLYKVIDVSQTRIVVGRISGGENAHFTQGEALRAIEQLKNGLRVPKGELIHTVLRETMLVHLHPNVSWDPTSKELYWKAGTLDAFDQAEQFIADASNDELEKIMALITKRKNQGQFRANLLTLYQGRCAISSVNASTVLVAAHIVDHAKSGINSNDNGILLRSDLHNLFDAGLLKIDPDNLTIHLDESLRDSYYSQYEGSILAKCVDDSRPSELYLTMKWNEFNTESNTNE